MEIPEPAVPAVIVLLLFTTLATLILGLRLYTRIVLVRNVGADDYLMTAAVTGSIAFMTVVFLQIKNGLGREITLQELPGFLEALWGTIPLYNCALIFCKLSIVIQYYRVFRNPFTQRLLKLVLLFLVVYGLWAILGTVFTCFPVAKYWDLSIQTGHCLNKNVVTFTNAGINIGTDLVLLAIPLVLLKDLQIPTKQKMILLGVFACGAFACAVSIVRLKALNEIGAAPPSQQSVRGVSIAIWSCLEINVGIICACVPALKALVTRLAPKFLLSSVYGGRSNPYAPRSRGRGNGTGSGNRGNDKKSAASSSRSTRKNTHITVQQTIEMNEMHSGEKGSPGVAEESQENLVSGKGSWRTDCYAGSSTHVGLAR